MSELYDDIAGTYEGTLKTMKDKFAQLAGYSPDDASDIGMRMQVLAGEVYSIGCAVDWLKRQTFAQSATGTELEMRAMERGLARKPAACAQGTLTFGRTTALWYSVTISAGTVCATSGKDPVRYVTTVDTVLGVGDTSVDVPAQAQTGGKSGNAAAKTVTVMVTPPNAMEYVTNKAPFTGGMDAESDEELRGRLMDCWGEPANGTNAAWYRQLATSCDGVRSANVVPRANGVGTAAVYLAGRGAGVSDAVVRQVQAVFSAKREINVDVTVQSAQTTPANISVIVERKPGMLETAVQSLCGGAIREYLYGLGVGDPVVPAAVTVCVMETGAVTACTITTPAVSVAANQLAVPNDIIVTVN